MARKLSAVRALYSYLSERRVLAGSPAAGVKGPQLRREPRGRAIGDGHMRVLLAAAVEHSDQAQAIVRLLLLNGLRVSEVCKANVEDLQREPGGGYSLLVRGKGGKHASVALNASTQLAVLAVLGTRSSGPLFRRQDARRTRHDAGAPWLAYNRQAVSRLLIEPGRPRRATDGTAQRSGTRGGVRVRAPSYSRGHRGEAKRRERQVVGILGAFQAPRVASPWPARTWSAADRTDPGAAGGGRRLDRMGR